MKMRLAVITVIGGKVYVAWKRKMLRDVIGGHQAYIDEKIYGASNFDAGKDHARLGDCECALRATKL